MQPLNSSGVRAWPLSFPDLMTILSIAHKFFSLKDRIEVKDQDDAVRYIAKNSSIFWPLSFTLSAQGEPIAHIRRRIFALRPTWIVTMGKCQYTIQCKLMSFTSRFFVTDGPYDGAWINGNLLGLKFEINHLDRIVAKANAKILTLRDRHMYEVFDPKDEIFATVAMLIVLKSDERKKSE